MPDRLASGCSTAHHKMQDERYHRKDEKYVDETASNVEHCESPEPCDQKDNKQARPDAHISPIQNRTQLSWYGHDRKSGDHRTDLQDETAPGSRFRTNRLFAIEPGGP